MAAIGKYVFSLVCGGIFCSVILSVAGGGTGAQIRKMLCGLFLVFLAISPIKELDYSQMTNDLTTFSSDAVSIVSRGEEQASQAVLNIITETCASYILTEAAQLGAEVSVEVAIDQDTMVPVSVTISGTVTPYAKQILISYITQNFGIEKEAQHWVSP